MTDTIEHWNEAAWAVTEKLPGAIGTDLRLQWKDLADQEKVMVTFFGPYDSGKSTLLKRLLADDGCEVPDWLTISPRRETFEQNKIEALGLMLRDTPGIAGGNDLHEAEADDALLTTDAVVVVLPPHLVTGDRKTVTAIISVLDGSRFNCKPTSTFAPGGLLIALSRKDEAGANPEIDLPGYQDLMKRKRRELRDLLAAKKVDESNISIHAIVADPSGMVGNQHVSGPGDYDSGRAWDGVAEFAASLRALADRKAELRLWSERRFLSSHLGTASRSLEERVGKAKLACDAARNEVESHDLQTARLQALLGAARADLNHRVAEEVQSACRRGDSDHKVVLGILNERITSSLDRWWNAQDAALQTVATEIDAEVNQRRTRPDWQAMFGEFSDEAAPRSEGKATGSATSRWKRDDIQRMNTMLQKGFREAVPTILDMPLEKARVELQRLTKAGSFQEYARQSARRVGTLTDAAHAEKARKALLVDAGFAVAVPAIIEIAGVINEQVSDAKAAEERIKKRTELQAKVDKAARALADKTWGLWHDEGLPAALASALREAKSNATLRSEALLRQQELATETRDLVQAVLDRGAH